MIRLTNLITESNETKMFDQSKVNSILSDIGKITNIKNGYNSYIEYVEHRWKDGTGSFEFKWESGRGAKHGIIHVSVNYIVDRNYSISSQYSTESFVRSSPSWGVKKLKLGIKTNGWDTVTNDVLVKSWKKSKPLVIKIDKEVEKWKQKSAAAEADYYRKRGPVSGVGNMD